MSSLNKLAIYSVILAALLFNAGFAQVCIAYCPSTLVLVSLSHCVTRTSRVFLPTLTPPLHSSNHSATGPR